MKHASWLARNEAIMLRDDPAQSGPVLSLLQRGRARMLDVSSDDVRDLAVSGGSLLRFQYSLNSIVRLLQGNSVSRMKALILTRTDPIENHPLQV